MTKNYSFEFIAILFSAVIHVSIAIPYLSGKFTASSNKQTTTPLKLAMFKAAPEPIQNNIPEPVKPVAAPPKPLKPKPVVKKKPKPVLKKKPKPIVKAKPKPVIQPVEEKEAELPEPELEPSPEIAQTAPPPQPAAPIEAEPERLTQDLRLIARLEDQYKYTLSKLIDSSKKYPRRAQRRNLEGRAIVSFVILRDGRVKEIHLIDSTGHEVLDKAVIQAIEAVSGKLPLPEELNRQQWQLKIPMSFTLS